MRTEQYKYRLSHSEIQTFKRCRRKWYLQYYMRYRRKSRQVRVPRETGIIVHGALHEYYKNDHDEDAAIEWLKTSHDTAMAVAESYELPELRESYKFAGTIVDGYFEWLAETGHDAHIQVTGSEIELTAPAPIEGVELFGIVDLMGTHAVDGDIVVLDTKVVASIEETIRLLHMNEQAMMYALLAKANDPDPKRNFRVVWSMLKRSKRTARAQGPFYERYELVISPGQLEVFYQQLHGVVSQILQLENAIHNGAEPNAVAYPSPTKDCSWDCDFIAVCPAMNDPNSDPNWLLNQYFDKKDRVGSSQSGATVADVEQVPVEVTRSA